MRTLIFFSLLLISVSGFAQEKNPQKLKDIRHLMEIDGCVQVSQNLLGGLLYFLEMKIPNAPKEVWEEEVKKINQEAHFNSIALTYDSLYTHKEIKDLITFFESPSGKKYLEAMPQLQPKIIKTSNRFNELEGQKVYNRIKELGY